MVWLVFSGCLIRFSAWKPVIFTEGFRILPLDLQANVGIVCLLRPRPSRSTSLNQHDSPIWCHVSTTEKSLRKYDKKMCLWRYINIYKAKRNCVRKWSIFLIGQWFANGFQGVLEGFSNDLQTFSVTLNIILQNFGINYKSNRNNNLF
jgi:hypothetical protein